MAGVNDIVSHGFGSWSTVAKVPTLGFGIGTSSWTDPTCTITTGVTMAGNTVATDVTMAANSATWNVTMPASSVTEDVGMGCGNQ